MLSSTHMTTRDGRQLSFAEGRTASDVTGTTLLLDDGTRVRASTANGWFVAWWPGVHDVKSADVTTPGATTTQTFHDRAGSRPGPAPAGLPPAPGPSQLGERRDQRSRIPVRRQRGKRVDERLDRHRPVVRGGAPLDCSAPRELSQAPAQGVTLSAR